MVKLSGQIIATSSFGETWVNNNRSFTIPPVALVAAIFQVFFCKKEKSTTYLSRTDIKYPKHEILSRFMLRSVFPFHKVQFQVQNTKKRKSSLRWFHCFGLFRDPVVVIRVSVSSFVVVSACHDGRKYGVGWGATYQWCDAIAFESWRKDILRYDMI